MLSIAVFVLSVGVVAYVLVGYPVLLVLLAKARGRELVRGGELKTVTVLLPVYNGEAWVRDKLRSILSLDYPRELLQVLVIDDGSTDATAAAAREFSGDGVEVLTVPRGGKARAINAGLQKARGEILFFTDVRQALDGAALRNLVSCFADPAVGVVSGELVIRRGSTLEEEHVGLYWRYEKVIRKSQSAIDSMLGATGCIYAMRAALAVPLKPDAILDDVNLPLGAFFQGYRIVLDATARAYDFPTSLDSEFRRKVRTQAGVYQTIATFPALLGPRNRMWLHFCSQKAGRLLLPWAMGLILLSSFGLPDPWRVAALGAHVMFYAVAALDLAIGEGSALKRLTSPARTVFVLIFAAFCAAIFPLLPGKRLWQTTRVNAAMGNREAPPRT